MKKHLIIALSACAILCGCSSQLTVTKTLEPNSEIAAKVAADLAVSPQRISYTYTPTAETKHTNLNNILQIAVEEALIHNGGGDLLVDLKYTYTAKTFFFLKKVQSITVSGYPAKYVAFHNLRCKGTNQEGTPVFEEVSVSSLFNPQQAKAQKDKARVAEPQAKAQKDKARVAEPQAKAQKETEEKAIEANVEAKPIVSNQKTIIARLNQISLDISDTQLFYKCRKMMSFIQDQPSTSTYLDTQNLKKIGQVMIANKNEISDLLQSKISTAKTPEEIYNALLSCAE